ncbi:hypothetical protein HYPSUDRAFT_82352 [Hypholoma sublateritium FD-334 SS-4]|uniref:Mitochondrial carrier n=1 Tax=Hypholoma sublateritium (strain FD-334 SS-4) TaxID=945553 RepID=A0A0D2MXH9_HYPSF|nr:hypothetical protein HYPSUDRAFT_82352 [Hypholoma sublateritium FD-334 SS-4]
MTSTLPPLVQAFSGAIGSAFANGLTYPLDLVTTRLQLDSPERSKSRGGAVGGLHLLAYIIKRHGVGALYDGLWADTCATLLSNFFYFYIYSFLRMLSVKNLIPFTSRGSQSSKSHKPTLMEELVIGFIAGVASRAVSTPLNIITLRTQTGREEDKYEVDVAKTRPPRPADSGGIIEIVKLVYKEQGLAGFWRGFQMSTLLSLNPSITMGVLQMYRRLLGILKYTPTLSPKDLSVHAKNSIVNHNLRPWEAFFGGAISNSIAVSILYPLILGKKRLQISQAATMHDVMIDTYKGKNAPLTRNNTLPGENLAQLDAADDHKIGGIQALYQGYQLKIISGFLSQGVTFLVKGRIEQLVIAAYLARIRGATR